MGLVTPQRYDDWRTSNERNDPTTSLSSLYLRFNPRKTEKSDAKA